MPRALKCLHSVLVSSENISTILVHRRANLYLYLV